MTAVQSLRGLAAYFHSLVHESVHSDAMAVARHQSFIASHLLGGLIALAVFPVYLAAVGRPTLVSAFAFIWFLSPIAIAIFLSRTGRLGLAHLISAANLTGLVIFASALTGGITSFLVAWIIVVPLEASLSSERRIVLASIAIACIGLVSLGVATLADMLPQAQTFALDPALLAMLGIVSALVYAGGLAISVQIVHAQSEDAIRQGERRYRLLAENTTDMITRHDASGNVAFASLAAQHLLGVSSPSLCGSGLFERVHVADRPAYLAALNYCAAEKQFQTVEFRVRARRPAGTCGAAQDEFVWMEMRCRPVIGSAGDEAAAGTSNNVVAVTRDITERKIHEEEVLRARDQAEGASRAKTQFLANMSHELRTPLNAIIGFSEILTRQLFGTLGDERYKEYSQLIYESGEHLLTVVNEILDMSKIEAGKFSIVAEPFDCPALVDSCCQLMGHQAAQKNVTIATEFDDNLPELVADKRACKQMVLNLLSNAVKFTQDGGRVEARIARAGDMMVLAVEDSGIGIAEKDLPNLGNPFVQAETSYSRSYEGTGLGLSVVKGLAELHGGSLEIRSKVGIGTVVTIKLPVEGLTDGVVPIRELETSGEMAHAPEAARIAVGG